MGVGGLIPLFSVHVLCCMDPRLAACIHGTRAEGYVDCAVTGSLIARELYGQPSGGGMDQLPLFEQLGAWVSNKTVGRRSVNLPHGAAFMARLSSSNLLKAFRSNLGSGCSRYFCKAQTPETRVFVNKTAGL